MKRSRLKRVLRERKEEAMQLFPAHHGFVPGSGGPHWSEPGAYVVVDATSEELGTSTSGWWPASRERAREAEERAAARVSQDATAVETVGLMAAHFRKVLATGPSTADALGEYLDGIGVPRKLALRRRLVSTCVNAGRRMGYWIAAGLATGRAGRPMTVWKLPDGR